MNLGFANPALLWGLLAAATLGFWSRHCCILPPSR
jgi:hypothetical protein